MGWHQGRVYRELRRARGWSQQRLAGELGASQPRIWQIEASPRVPREPTSDSPRYDAVVDRGLLDDLLAVGERQRRDRLVYAVTPVKVDGLRATDWLEGAVVVLSDRGVADAIADLASILGDDEMGVVPVWTSALPAAAIVRADRDGSTARRVVAAAARALTSSAERRASGRRARPPGP